MNSETQRTGRISGTKWRIHWRCSRRSGQRRGVGVGGQLMVSLATRQAFDLNRVYQRQFSFAAFSRVSHQKSAAACSGRPHSPALQVANHGLSAHRRLLANGTAACPKSKNPPSPFPGPCTCLDTEIIANVRKDHQQARGAQKVPLLLDLSTALLELRLHLQLAPPATAQQFPSPFKRLRLLASCLFCADSFSLSWNTQENHSHLLHPLTATCHS